MYFIEKLNLEKHHTLIFWMLCVVLSVLQYFFGLQHFYFDAERYWECGRDFKVDGVFSMYNHTTTRGVLFPLFNYGLIELLGYLDWHEISTFKCLSATFTTWGLWYVLPGLYARATHQHMGVVNKLVLVIITNIFWFRYFSCPLTDFLCLFLLLQGFLLLWTDKISIVNIVFVGLICGFCFNTRPIYNLLLGIYPLFYFLVSKEKWYAQIGKVILLLATAITLSIPQYLLNKKVWKTETFLQPTVAYFWGKSLYLEQLKWGLYIQKYETYIGDFDCYEIAPVFYFHDRTESGSQEVALIDSIGNYDQYFDYLSAHPSRVLWFGKNLFNGLDTKHNTPYIYHIKPQLWFSILNYICWFCGIVLVTLNWRKWVQTKGFKFILIYLLATCALSVPIAIEVRFLAAMYFLLYLFIAADFKTLFSFVAQRPVQSKLLLLGLLIVFVGVCLLVSQTTFAQIEKEILCNINNNENNHAMICSNFSMIRGYLPATILG